MRIQIDSLAPMLLADNQHALPAPRFSASITHRAEDEFPREFTMDMDIEVNRWGRGRCTRLEVRSLDGDSVSGALLRKLPIQRFVAQAVAEAGSWHGPGAPVDGGVRFDALNSDERTAAYERLLDTTRQPRRGDPITDEHLEQVAEVYRAAVAANEPPLRSVEDAFEAKRATASKWVAKARKRGFLPATQRGRVAA